MYEIKFCILIQNKKRSKKSVKERKKRLSKKITKDEKNNRKRIISIEMGEKHGWGILNRIKKLREESGYTKGLSNNNVFFSKIRKEKQKSKQFQL